MNKAVVQICAFCWLFLLRLIMHGTNIKLKCVSGVAHLHTKTLKGRFGASLFCLIHCYIYLLH
jgi:hypothetical protein